MDPDSYDLSYLSTSALHCLFDNYLPPNKGNQPLKAMEFFRDFYNENYINDKKIIDLIQKSIDFNKELNLSEVDEYVFIYFNEDRDNYTDKFSNTNIFLINNYNDIETDDGFKFKYTKGKINNDIPFKFYKEDIKKIILKEFAKFKFTEIIEEKILTINELIIPSGWKSSEGGGHLISFFYQKIDEEIFKLIIFNSGSGLQYHEKDKENELYNITRSVVANKETTIEIISFILLLNKLKTFENKDKGIKAENYYYGFINEYFKNEITNDNVLNEIKFQNEQLSGSCTFFGFYYNFFYINTKYNVNVEDYKAKLRNYSEKILINEFEENKKQRKEMDESLESWNKEDESLESWNKEDEKYYYYTELEKCIIDLIKQSSNKSNDESHKEKMLLKIDNNYNNYIKYLKYNEFKLDTSKGILISEYDIIKNINIESIEKVLFSLKEYNYGTNSSSNKLFSILILRYSLDQNDDFFQINNLGNVNIYLANLFDLLLGEFSGNIFILKLIIIRIIDVNYKFGNMKDQYSVKQADVFENISDIHYGKNTQYLYRIKPLDEKNFNLYKQYYKLINLKILEKYEDYIKVSEIESNLIKDLSNNYDIDLREFISLFSLVTNQDFGRYDNILRIEVIIIKGPNILFKVKEIKDIKKKIKNEFKEDNLNKKNYIDPNKIINFLNNQEIDNINNYYNDFFKKAKDRFYNIDYDRYTYLLNDEYNINRIDLFNVEKNDNKYLYNVESGTYYYNFSYSSIFNKNKLLIKNLDQEKLINNFYEIDDFGKINIIILLYSYDLKFVEKLKNIIIEYETKDDNFKLHFKLLKVLFYDNFNLDNLFENDEIKKNSLTEIKDDVFLFYLFSLILDKEIEKDNSIKIFDFLSLNNILNYIDIKKDEIIINVEQTEDKKKLFVKKKKNNDYFDEYYLNVNYKKNKKYLDNFKFKKINEEEEYIGSSDIFNYELNCKIETNNSNNLIIEREYNKKNYKLKVIKDRNEFYEKHGNICYFFHNEDDYFIEIFNKKHYKTNDIFRLKFFETKYSICLNEKENEILFNESPIYNKWILNIPLSFLFKDFSTGKYKIIFMDLFYMSDYLKSIWNDEYNLNKLASEGLLNAENDKFYTAEISYNGLELIFENKESMYIYIKLCIFFGKSDCLTTLINKINFQEIEIYDKKLKVTKKIEEVKLYDKQLYYILKFKLYNSPFAHYFEQIKCFNINYEINIDYIKRLNRDAYNLKYNLFNYSDIESYNKKRLYEFDMFKKSNDIFNDIFKRSKDFNDDQKVYFNKIKSSFQNNIIESIIEFKNKYETCILDNEYTLEDFLNEKEDLYWYLSSTKKLQLTNLEKKIILSENDVNTIILENYCCFYKLLECKMLDETLSKIENKLRNDPDCTEVSRIFETINLDIIYTEERSKEIILFEIFFGSFIRKEQYNIYKNICNEISNKSNYNIYQLLMGRGKTSVILPLITFKYIFEENNYKNIIISLPLHLVSQSFEEMNNKFSYVLNKYPIFKFSKINRNECENFKYFDDIPLEDNSIIKFYNIKNNIKKIIISECNSLKVLKLNYVENNNLNNRVLNLIKNNSLIIFDEFDSLYNPLNSDLNFPVNDEKKIYEIIDKKIILFFVDLIEFLLNKHNKIPKLNENILNEFIKNKENDEIYKLYIDLLKNYLNEKNLEKELELVVNKKAKVIKIDYISEKEINVNYINDKNLLIKEEDIKNEIDDKLGVNSKSSFMNEENLPEREIILSDDEKDVKSKLSVLKLFNIFESSINLIYNKDYGFPNEKSHADKSFSVPYSHVNNPVEQSKFSDIDINFFLTTLTYFYSDIRIFDIKNIIKIIKNKLNIVKSFINDNSLMLSLIYPYDKMIGENNVKNLLKINYNAKENEHYLEEYKNYFNKLNDIKKNEFKKYYVLNNIISELKVSPEFYNCSFIDIMCKNFSLKKTGFSGTVNIKLPILDDNEIDNCKYKIKSSSDSYKNEFTGICPSNADNGSIYLSILGLFSNYRDLHKFNKNEEEIDKDKSKEYKFKQILDIIIKENYDSFIDSGAFLIDFTSEEAIKKFYDKLNKKTVFIYINNNDEKKVIKRSEKWEESDYKNEIYDTSELFIYYDNKHIIGTDIKQPNKLKGLVSISSFNKVTDVAQASYRLRQINYGHIVDYIIDDKLNYKTRIELLKFLNNNENNFICFQSEIKKNLQNINYLKREEKEENESYKIDKFIYYTYINKKEKFLKNYLYINHYLEFIKESLENNKFKNINKYLINLIDKDENFMLEQEQEKEQEQEQEQEKDKDKDKDLDREIILNEEIKIDFEFNINKLIIDELLNFESYPKILIKGNDDNKIYFSKFFMKLDNIIGTDFPGSYILEKYKDIENNMLLLKNKNIYYLKSKNEYIIISPIEFDFLFDYSMNVEVNLDYEIFDKRGINITFNKDEQKIIYKKTILEPVQYFIKYLFGSELKLEEYFYMFNLIRYERYMVNYLIDLLEIIFLVEYPNRNYFKDFENNIDVNDIDLKSFLENKFKFNFNEVKDKIDQILKDMKNNIIQYSKDHYKERMEAAGGYYAQIEGYNLLNYFINQLGGNKKNSRLNNGKNLIKKYNN